MRTAFVERNPVTTIDNYGPEAIKVEYQDDPIAMVRRFRVTYRDDHVTEFDLAHELLSNR